MTLSPSNNFLSISEPFSEDKSQFLYQMTTNNTLVSYAVNNREISQYLNTEINSGQNVFDLTSPTQSVQVFRSVFPLGASASGATITITHGITGITGIFRLYAVCTTNVPDFRPIPYVDVSAVANGASMLLTTTSIIITLGAGFPNVVSGYAIIEYLKN